MRIIKPIILMTCISILAACTTITGNQTSTKSNTATSNAGFAFSPIAHANTAELLDFMNHYTQASKTQQKSIYKTVAQKLAKNKEDKKLNIKKAAMLALPDSVQRDTQLAQQTLQALLIDQSLNQSDKNLVKLLYTFTVDFNAESQKRHDSNKQIDALKKRNQVLSKKLTDLKDIETTMIKRNSNINK